MRSNLIYQDRENPDGVVFNPELLDDEQNWAYLRATQTQPDFGDADDEQEQLQALIYGQTSGKGLKTVLAQKERNLNASSNSNIAQTTGEGAAGGEGASESANFDRLRSILDSDDPRFERLHKENIQHLERGVAALSDNMGLSIDQFYARTTETYRDIRHQTNFAREALLPQANVEETCPEMIDIAKSPWQFGNLPGVYSRVPKLVQEHQLLEKLQARLKQMRPMELWSEPVESMPQPSESFFHTIQELLGTICSKDLEKMHSTDRDELVSLQANALQSVFGLAVLSGSYEMIASALHTIQDFTEKATEDNIITVFQMIRPAIESYLAQILAVANERRAYHTLHGDNISAIFGSQMKNYPNSQFSRNNTSIATDGSHIYLLIGQEKRATMYKIGTGLGGTLAGRVYVSARSKKEGNMTWAFCQGKLYMRRAGEAIGAVQVLDPTDFRVVTELNLDLEAQFEDSKELLRKNRNYPLLSDGDDLYTIVMTVEKRERAIKEEHKEKAAALQNLKQSEREKQQKEQIEAEEAKEKEKAAEESEREGSKQHKTLPSTDLLVRQQTEEIDEVDFFHGQQYFVVVFKALKFDLCRNKESKPKADDSKEIDFLSMTEAQLFDMPIVHEMFATFSGFYNIKRCALALQHNNDDIHDAGQWLIDEKDAPYFRAHAEKQKQIQKKQPLTIEVGEEFVLSEAVLKSKWDENSKDNPEIACTGGLLYPECLECGKWTINGDQITYHTDYRQSIANFVFSMRPDDIQTKSIANKEQVALEKSSFENSRQQAAQPERAPVPAYIVHKRRGPGEEELNADMVERIRTKFNDHDPENTGNIGMESLGEMLSDLGLVNEEDGDAMEEAFQGLDVDERDTLGFEEFMTIARRLSFKKKLDDDKKKMADITEEQLESVFNRYKGFNQASEEDCLSMSACYDALRRLKIKMNPREYERKFFDHDTNRDRHINLEEFRQFLGKEPREEQKQEPKKKTKVHVSNLVFFWDDIEWLSYTPQEVSEGTHVATKESKRAEIAKKSPERAQVYDWTSEWSLYEDITVRTANIFIEADRGRQLEHGVCYVTYDKHLGKFVCMSLTHAFNFFMVDDLSKTVPKTFAEAPTTVVQSMANVIEKTLNLLAWVNERRFQMPWRWSLWSQTFTNVLQYVEHNKTFLRDLYIPEEDKQPEDRAEAEEARKNAVKRIKKRLQLFIDRELTRELYRLDQPTANNEQAIAYRAKKVQKERSKNQKQEKAEKTPANLDESHCESEAGLQQYVLPIEKIYLAQENRKLFAFCTTGNERVLRMIYGFLLANPQSEACYRALLDCVAYADHLLAYHDQALVDKVREFLTTQVGNAQTSQSILQYIWRILVVGWYKFASNAEQQISLLSLFVAKSQPLEKQQLEDGRGALQWLNKLLATDSPMTPIELFNHRFYSTPAAFFFLEMIQISKVGRYHVCLKSEELLDPQPVEKKDKEEVKKIKLSSSYGAATQEVPRLANVLAKLDTSVLSTTMPLDGPDKGPIAFRNKSKISLTSNYEKLLDCPQVNQSLTKVPIEYVVLQNLKAGDDPMLPVTESYFSMPLYQILNEEMINFDSPDLPKDDLEFLCQRYSDERILESPDMTPRERKETWFALLVQLRESNQDGRESLVKSMMRAITQSQGTEQNVEYSWDDQSSPAMINVLRRLLQAAYAILKVHNPRHLRCTIDMLGLIDEALSKMRRATEDFSQERLTETNLKWLDQMKQLLMTVVQNMECNLGYVMQTELAVNSLPLLISIFENVKGLFSRRYTASNSEDNQESERIANILESLTTLNIEGTDPASYRIFESVHPLAAGSYQIKDFYQVPRAIGYMIEFDPQTSKCHDGNIHLRTSRTTHELHPRDIDSIRNLVLVGSSLHVRFSNGGGAPKSWGIKLTVKPIIGKPQQLSNDPSAIAKELETLLTTTKAQDQSLSCVPSTITSWINLINQISFLMSFLTRGLQECDLISQQTNGRLQTGAGILKNFGKSAAQLRKEAEYDEALNYALPKWSEDQSTPKSKGENSTTVTSIEIDKKQLLEWHLFKSGLCLPAMEDKSSSECVMEGLRLVSDSLVRRQDETFDSLQNLSDEVNKKKNNEAKKLSQQRTDSFMRRQTTLMKLDEAADQFSGRKEVWPAEVNQLMDELADGSGSLVSKVLKKMRAGLGPEQFGYASIWMVPSARPHRPLWLKVQQLFVAATIYHSDLVATCETFIALSDDRCADIASNLQESPTGMLSADEQVVYPFLRIRQKVDALLTWMKSRLDGQKYFTFTVKDTLAIAQELVAQAVSDHRQAEELRLMREAEDETIAYNLHLKEQEAIEAAKKEAKKQEEEARKKVEAEQNKKRKQSAGKLRSSAPAGMRRNQRANVQRLARAVPKAQIQKKGQGQPSATAPAALGHQSPLVTAQEDGDESKLDEEERDKVLEDKKEEEEVELVDLTDSELASVKKEIYDKGFKKFETEYGNHIAQLCSFFDIELDTQDRSKTLRAVFRNIKSRLASYIDFDVASIPIPAKFNEKIIKVKNPHEEVAHDVLSRLTFLFEVKRSNNYQSEVTKQLKVGGASADGVYGQLTFEEEKQAVQTVADQSKARLRAFASQSESLNALLQHDSSPLQAIYVFAKSPRVSNLVHLRNTMLDQLYTANFRLHSMQILQQLYTKITPTIFSRFVQGSVSYALANSTLHQIETCGEKTSRRLNAVSCEFVKFIMHQINQLQAQLLVHERDLQEQEKLAKEEKPQSYLPPSHLMHPPPSGLVRPANYFQPNAGGFSAFGQPPNELFKANNMQLQSHSHMASREHAIAKAQSKKAFRDTHTLIEDQRKMLQGLNDIRVLLSNQYSKEYFLGSLRRANEPEGSGLKVGTVAQFFKVLIQHVVGTQSPQDDAALASSGSSSAQAAQGAAANVQNLRTQLSNVSRAVLDSLLISNQSKSSSMQQLLIDIANEIVVEQLERVCYEKGHDSKGQETTFVKIDDFKHKDEYISLLKLFSELTRGSGTTTDKVVDAIQKQKVNRSAQLLANMVLRVRIPEVVRITAKCAKIYLRRVDLREIQLMRSAEESEDQNSLDFLSEALRTIGARISNSENPITAPAACQPEEDKKEQVKPASLTKIETGSQVYQKGPLAQADQKQDESESGKEYFVYSSLNQPLEEDFAFVVTTLWHWYQVNPHPNLKLVTDPAEITVQVPPEEKKEEEKKAEEGKANQPEGQEGEEKKEADAEGEEKKQADAGEENKEVQPPAEEQQQEEEKKAEGEADANAEQPAQAEEEKKEEALVAEEEKKDGQVEEEKGEPDAIEEEKKEPSEEEKKQLADEEAKEQARKAEEEARKAEEEAKEAALKAEEEAKEKQRADEEAAAQKEKELTEKHVISRVLECLKEIWPDFEANEGWLEIIKNFKPKQKTESVNKTAEEVIKSIFAPALEDILQRGKGSKYPPAECIKECEEAPKKIIELQQILKLIIEATYTDPTSNDSEEVKQQKMKEKNFNTLLLAVMDDAVKIATAMSQRRSAPIAGPFPLHKAHQLTQLLNRAYAKGLTPVPLNPFMKSELTEKKITFREAEISAKDMMPITEEHLRTHCGKPDKKAYFTRFTISIAPRELKVTLCEKQTAADLEEELLRRGKIADMNFPQPRKSDHRGSGGLRLLPMSQPDAISSFKQFVQSTGASRQAIIQELIQLVRSLIQDESTNAPQMETPRGLRRKSTKQILEDMEREELSVGSVQQEIITKVNGMLREVGESESWMKQFSTSRKQAALGLISVIGGWQPCLATGQLVRVESESSGGNTALVINDNFGKGKLSVLPLTTEDTKIAQIDADQIQPIYSSSLSMNFGRHVDAPSLFKAITSLQKQILDAENEDFMGLNALGKSASDSIFSPEFLLQMLLKVVSRLASFRGDRSQAVLDLIQVLIQISERGQNDCEQEGKAQSFWELELAKQWAGLIDNSQEANTNLYLPREFYQSQEQADNDADMKVLADLGMQELMKRASTSVQEARFADVDFVQNKNYYLTGLSGQGAMGTNKQEVAKTRKIKFFVDNVLPRAADVVAVDAYRSEHQRIQYVMLNVKMMLCMNWSMGIDELKYACKGSEINFPDQHWDWSALFFDEIAVDSWVQVQLKRKRRVNDEDEDEADEGETAEEAQKLGVPLLDKLLDLGVEDILVQIKAIEYKRHCVLAEYTDTDSMTKHWLWIPIVALSKPTFQMEPAAIGFLPQTLNLKFKATLQNTAIAYARQSLLKIAQALQSDTNESLSLFKMPAPNLKLHDIISWAVWEKYGSQPVIGWMSDLRQIIVPKKVSTAGAIEEEKKSLTAHDDIDEEQASTIIRKIFNECVDEFASLQLSPEEDFTQGTASAVAESKSETLNQVKQAFDDLVQKIEIEGSSAESSEPVQMFHALVDQCAENWGALAEQIESEKAVIDICKEFENLRRMQSESQAQGGNSLPLHELLPHKGKNAISTTLMFKRNGARITPGSKVQFWSDPDQLNMLREIHFVKDQKLDMEPIRMPEGKIWVSIEESVDIDILGEDEVVHEPKLEFVVFQVPKEWTVVCWLTETITSSLMKEGAVKSTEFAIRIFEKLMQAIMAYYSRANAPGLLKSVTLRLIARLVVKIRFLYHQLEKAGALPAGFEQKSHLEKLFISTDFLKNLMAETKTYMQTEEEDIYNQNKAQLLYPALVQDAAELLMNLAVPTQKAHAFATGTELLSSASTQLELPDWTDPLVNVSHFLHFFRGEARLPQKLLDQIFAKTTSRHFKHQLDNVVVVRRVPSLHKRYTRTWIVERLVQILTMHQTRIIDPQRDIHIMPDEEDPQNFHSIVIFLDDFSHLRKNDKEGDDDESEDEDDLAPKIVPLYSETDDEREEGDGNGDGDQPKDAAAAEDERPSMYNCRNVGVCGGFENDIDNGSCVVCDTPRPPMEELIEAHAATRKAEKAAAKAAAAQDAVSDDEEGEPLHHLRLKKLKRDIRHVISHDQRLIALQRLEEAKGDEEERKRVEEAKKQAAASEEQQQKAAQDAEEEKKAEDAKAPDSDDSPADEEPMIDLDNLPEDRRERLRLLGVDEALIEENIEEGGELLDMIEQGALDELVRAQEKKKEEQTARRKRRKAKEDARKAAELKESGQADALIKLEVSIMREGTFDGETKVKETLSKALQARVQATGDEEAKEFELSHAAKEAIRKLHKLFQTLEVAKLAIPREIEDKLADFGIRKETLKSNSADDVIAKMRTIVLTDPIAFFKLIVSQGFDFWFTQACFPVCDLKRVGLQMRDLRDISVLRRVRQLVETDFCKDRGLVSELDPALLRLVRQVPDRSEVKDFSHIRKRGDTTDEEEVKEAKMNEEEKKGEPDEVVEEEEKKELAEEEDKEGPEDEAKRQQDLEAKAKSKADREAKLTAAKQALQKIRIATIFDVWLEDSAISRDTKAMTEEQKTKLKSVQATLQKPKNTKIFQAWKGWAQKHASDRKLTWEQTLQSTRPISCFNDISVQDVYAEVLQIFDQAQLRFVWTFIRIFNKYLAKAIRFINQTHTPVAVPEEGAQPMCISAYLNSAKDLCLAQAKTDLKYLIVSRTAIPVADDAQLPRMVFTRLKDASGSSGDDAEKPKARPGFIQAFEQTKTTDVSIFRQPKPQGGLPHLAFRAVFRGEDVEGDGGPYRQVFQDWSSELQPKKEAESPAGAELLDLLKPCANQTGGEPIGKDRFVLNTGNNSAVDLQKYYFLGVLMGICCRTGVIFSLDLPKMFWKQMTGQRVTLDDVVEVEWRFLRSMQQMLSFSKDVFEMMPQYWNTMLADDRQFDLTEEGDGETRQVEYEERFDYLRAALKARLTQTHAQMQAIRRGLCQIVPESLLNVGNLDDVETWICGSCKPNIALLRRHTEYPKDDADYAKEGRLMKDFWRFLDDCSEEDKKKFIIFCWGQQRLPPTDAAFENSNLAFKIKRHSGKDRRGRPVDMDMQLPAASTCFFHFTLPMYSTLEVMTQKILIAVHNDCLSMNAEVRRQHFHDGNQSEEEE